MLKLRRTSTKRSGGPLFHYSALCVVGDGEGRVGVGLAKSSERVKAIIRAYDKARKSIISVNITKDFSIPHEIRIKNGASKLLMKPAPLGTGIIAGGVVRQILSLAGYKNISVKVLGTNNGIMNAFTLMKAISGTSESIGLAVSETKGNST